MKIALYTLFGIVSKKPIINNYSDLGEAYSIYCYPLGEVIAEKMRSILQRTAPRDIYDLWYLFEVENLDIKDYIFAFQEKAKYKGYDPAELTEVIGQKKKTYAKHWYGHLANQMTAIPDFSKVWRELGKHWRIFQKFNE